MPGRNLFRSGAPEVLLNADLDKILRHTRPVWKRIRGKRLFITGGTGFIGTWLLESFIYANTSMHLGAEAVVLTRAPKAFRKKAPRLARSPFIRVVKGDVRSFRFPAGRFDYIIHAASETDTALVKRDPVRVADTVIKGTGRVLQFAVKKKVRRMLFVSSGAIYGRMPAGVSRIPETYSGTPRPGHALASYGTAKRIAEALCAAAERRYGLVVPVARCFAFIGPFMNLNASFAASGFIQTCLQGKPVVLKGDGTAVRSYMYAADLAAWLWKILAGGRAGEAYNVGSGHAVTVMELAKTVTDCFKKHDMPAGSPIRRHGKKILSFSGEKYVPSVKKARRELGLKIYTPFRQSVAKTVKFVIAQASQQ